MFFLEIFNFLTFVFNFIFCPQVVHARATRVCVGVVSVPPRGSLSGTRVQPASIDSARRAYDVHERRGGEVVTRWSQRAHTFTFTLCDSHAQTRRGQQVRAVVQDTAKH
jgi:hypothetical protein